MAGAWKFIEKLILFNEPKKNEQFILKENEEDKKQKPQKKEQEEEDPASIEISKKLEVSLEFMKKVYNIPISGDILIREFDINIRNKVIGAFILFFDGMTDRKVINDNILQPLMLLSNLDIKSGEKEVAEYVQKHLLPQNQLKVAGKYRQVMDAVNFGGCGIFIDGINVAFAADVKGWEHRGIERPNNELVIRGPQEGFNELLRSNTALLRKLLMDENLIAEDIPVGKRSKTPCAMMYIKDIANDSLVNEVRRRLKSLNIAYLLDSGELEQLIEDSTYFPAPQVVATERPDRTAAMLMEGKVAIIVSGSPYALVVPAVAYDLLHTPEDAYVRFPYANLLRYVRVLAIIVAMLLPGIYIAITDFHHEMIPTDLLLAIEASREKVPFPSVVELLIMELAFELIREAGIRIPGPIGPTLGIIGALILGQAAVAANIVSPILIIVVAVTGIGSFAIPNFSLGYSLRILRFVFIFLGVTAGFLGITIGLYMIGVWTAGTKSFGVPFLIPFGPKTRGGTFNEIFRAPVWKLEYRPDYLNPKKIKRQSYISMGWKNRRKGDKEKE